MRWLLAFCLVIFVASLNATQAGYVEAHGQPDGAIPGWTVRTVAPAGWTGDCCMYARAIGVEYVLYQGDWTGNPDRVMVLNVWPRKLPTLDDEWQADRKQYLQRDTAAKASAFDITNPVGMACHGVMYEGTDHVDDAVVFCDPGKAAGVRLSWSMTVAANDPLRDATLKLFRQVVEHSSYARFTPKLGSTSSAAAH